MRYIALILLRLYQKVISPFVGDCCRFHPSCSVYTYEAIEKYGFLKGTFLGSKRLLKCHPLHPGGIDPVP